MLKDHFEKVGGLGLASRLRRLSDYYMSQVKQIYKERNIDFDPKWFPLFSLLKQVESITITQAAAHLGFSHPHVIKLAKQLEKKKLISSKMNTTDARSRDIKLTTKGQNLAKSLEPIWANIRRSIEATVPELGVDFIKVIRLAEEFYGRQSLAQQVSNLEKKQKLEIISIERYSDVYKQDFEKLNRQWLEKYFTVEKIDEEFFADPDSKVIKKGGEIIFALVNDKVVGTCALFKNEDSFELARMAVDEDYRGFGIGDRLINEIINIARNKNARRIYLVTNSRLRPAIRLYEKYGFLIIHEGPHPLYRRADTIMERQL